MGAHRGIEAGIDHAIGRHRDGTLAPSPGVAQVGMAERAAAHHAFLVASAAVLQRERRGDAAA